jgi:hypothetical protein
VCSLAFASSRAAADPWLQPGDLALRHDIGLLADAGVIAAPISTWPMSWPDLARAVTGASLPGDASAGLRQALARVQRAARRAAAPGFSGLGYRVAGAERPTALRTYGDSPREEGELAVGASWLGDRLAANVRVTGAADPADDRSARVDGSYIGVNLANFMISVGWMERWWGPGWDGSLILSSNARPIPSLRIERNYTDAFETKWLRWIGPWRATIEFGELEGSDVPVPDARFFSARVNFRPLRWFEVGLSRTAQWCGEGRPCGFDEFIDLLIGRDNELDNGDPSDQPGNQMAGYDFRLASPWRAAPVALYGQLIGEDEAGALPSKFLGLFGAETWGGTDGGSSWRLRVEYADTACNFSRQEPEFGCAYRNPLYPQGYNYRGRPIGHAMDNDSRMSSVAGLWVWPRGDSLHILARRVELNRDGLSDPLHAVSPGPDDLDNVEIQYTRRQWGGEIRLGVGYDDFTGPTTLDSDFRGFLEWRYGL